MEYKEEEDEGWNIILMLVLVAGDGRRNRTLGVWD